MNLYIFPFKSAAVSSLYVHFCPHSFHLFINSLHKAFCTLVWDMAGYKKVARIEMEPKK